MLQVENIFIGVIQANHFCFTTNLGLPSLDIKFLNKLSHNLFGNYDFLSFSKFRKDLKIQIVIFSAYWEKDKDMYTFHIKANRYLHHMIRYIVGSNDRSISR